MRFMKTLERARRLEMLARIPSTRLINDFGSSPRISALR
jgi:hypothetical protein